MVDRTKSWFEHRSVAEIMVLLFTVTVVFMLIASTLTVVIAEIVDPSADTSKTTDALIRIMTSLIAALFGLLVGQSTQLHKRPDGTSNGLGPEK